MSASERTQIVVGVDGSEPSHDALRWVLQGADRDSAESDAKAVLQAAREAVGDRAVSVEYISVNGRPAGTLVDFSPVPRSSWSAPGAAAGLQGCSWAR